jgi:hypothetical protein
MNAKSFSSFEGARFASPAALSFAVRSILRDRLLSKFTCPKRPPLNIDTLIHPPSKSLAMGGADRFPFHQRTARVLALPSALHSIVLNSATPAIAPTPEKFRSEGDFYA